MKAPKDIYATKKALQRVRIIKYIAGFPILVGIILFPVLTIMYLWQNSIITGLLAVELTPVCGVMAFIFIMVWRTIFDKKEEKLVSQITQLKE